MTKKAPAKRKAVKPSRDKQVALICHLIAMGESLRAICVRPGMPDKATVLRWMADDDAFATKYARAREAQAEHHHDEMDRLEAAIESGTLNAQAGSVILGNKRWRMEKLKPKVYGNAIIVRGDPDSPVELRTRMSDAELEAKARGG